MKEVVHTSKLGEHDKNQDTFHGHDTNKFKLAIDSLFWT